MLVYSCEACGRALKLIIMEKLSAYAQKLPQEAKRRYVEKLSTIQDVDPFLLFQGLPVSTVQIQQCSLPLIDATDLVSYLVLQTSFVTLKQFKSHHSLESYNQFVNGWVKDVKGWKIAGKVVVTGRVSDRAFYIGQLHYMYFNPCRLDTRKDAMILHLDVGYFVSVLEK